MKPARVEIAAPGGKPTYVVRAPIAVPPESKRVPKMERQEKLLSSELEVLEEGTIRRNLEFYTQLDAIEELGKKWELKLKEEEVEQKQAHDELVSMFEQMLKETVFQEKKMLISDIEKYHTDLIPPQEKLMGQNEAGVEEFVGETIPALIDCQSGIVSRKLQKAHDTFDVKFFFFLINIYVCINISDFVVLCPFNFDLLFINFSLSLTHTHTFFHFFLSLIFMYKKKKKQLFFL
jgi:hypothetical protein